MYSQTFLCFDVIDSQIGEQYKGKKTLKIYPCSMQSMKEIKCNIELYNVVN